MPDQDSARPQSPSCAPWHAADPALSFSRQDIRTLDRLAADEFGIPSIVLMENAAIRIAEFAAGVLSGAERGSVLVFCGPGNNGGDGLATARHLTNAGFRVAVVLAASEAHSKGDAGTNLSIARAMKIPMFEADSKDPARAAAHAAERLGTARPSLVVDALLGTGLDRAPREPVRTLIGTVKEWGRRGVPVLSADIPSGLDADTGMPAGGAEGVAVAARWTVTLVGPKRGFAAPGAGAYLGEVHVADIGVPRSLVTRLGSPCGVVG